jgi:hypothetical protein
MARRVELSNIASGVLGSFVSRNNDFGGYWALGLLYLEAMKTGCSRSRIDLLEETRGGPSPLVEALTSKYRGMAFASMQRRELPAAWLKAAAIEIQFEAPGIGTLPLAVRERPFVAEMKVTTDRGREFLVRHIGKCWPHDPKREIRSLRA